MHLAKSQREQSSLRTLINLKIVTDFSFTIFNYLYSVSTTGNVMKIGLSIKNLLDCLQYWAILIASSTAMVTERYFGQRQWKNYLFQKVTIQVSRKD